MRWSQEEEHILLENYQKLNSVELAVLLPARTPAAIKQKRLAMRLTPDRCKSLTERFWTKVHKTHDCWIWTGSIDRYGYIGAGGRNTPNLSAHRVSWEIHYGKIPDGLCVCHICDNPICVNPNHLFLGTQRDNIADRVMKNRSRGHQQIGESNHNSQLSEDDVRCMRELIHDGITKKEIANQFEISTSHVRAIDQRRFWGHVT